MTQPQDTPVPPPPWSGLFPKGDFEWTLRMRLADPAEFFGSSAGGSSLLNQKTELLQKHPERHLAQIPEAGAGIGGLCEQLKEWGLTLSKETEGFESLTRQVEPDLLLMEHSSQKLIAASVCFPSSWEPARWIGRPLTEIHDVVPRLNPQIGPMIDQFLRQLRPGKAYRRANWSLSHGNELNFHPALKRPRIEASTPIDEVYLRLEHQIFSALPGAILMGIRIEPVHLLSLKNHPELWEHLFQKLETMPPDVAHYKSLDQGLSSLIRQMREIK